MTYNIGFASGAFQGTLADTHSRAHFTDNLDAIAALVRDNNVDVLLLQEVDVGSRRSYYINQLEYLQDSLGWCHATLAVDWNKYVPIMNLGKVRQGAAILSRFPVVASQAHVFLFDPKPRSIFQRLLYRHIVWSSPIMYAQLRIGKRLVSVFNVHLDVFQRSHRKYQVERLMHWITEQQLHENIIIGGDFNYHAVLRTYDAYRQEDEQLPAAFAGLWDLAVDLKEVFIDRFSTPDAIHSRVTFPELSRRPDFLFYSRGISLADAAVLQEAPMSDHLPVLAEFCL